MRKAFLILPCRILLMVTFLLLQTSNISGKTLPPGTLANIPPNIVIIFDTSGSMSMDINNATFTWGDGSDGHWGEDTDASNNDQANPDYYYNTGVLGFPPNDSRMYIGKHVLWDIMHDTSVTQGMRYGLMRYNQNETGSQYDELADWYSSANRNTGQALPNSADNIYYYWTQNGCAVDGDVLVECGVNTTNQIIAWIDGTESYPNNKELRGEGATPIGTSLMTAKKYFKGQTPSNDPLSSPIQHYCQKNYIILLTDGEETCGGNAVAAANQLRSINYDSNNYDIKTFVIGLAMAQSSELDDIANSGGTTEAYFAADYSELRNALVEIIGGIYAENYTSTSPLVMPGVSGSGNNLYVSTFLPFGSHQWEGHLKKYPLDSSGFLQGSAPDYTFVWDAGDILGNTANPYYLSSDSRKIFTAGAANSLKDPSAYGYNNFVLNNNSDLKALLGYGSDTDTTNTDKLIGFVRGKDVFDEDKDGDSTDDRWKLADIYHSDIMEAGPPPYYYMEHDYLTFKTNTYNGFNASTRPTVVYAGSNAGMLHSFDALTGVEKWGFVPPNLLGKLKDMVSQSANQSLPGYYVDSSPIIDDFYIDEDGDGTSWWQTVLICGERDGGRGYFTLDVTDPDNPRFLWSVSNNHSIEQIKVWRNTAAGVNETTYNAGNPAPGAYDYSALGHTWSVPMTGRVKIDDDGDPDTPAEDRWVAVFGAGYSDLPNVGTAVYVVDISDGSILKSFNITADNNDNIKNNVPSPASVIADDNGYIHSIYIGDLEGQMWKIYVGDQDVSNWSSCIIFDAEASSSNNAHNPGNERYIYNQPELSYHVDDNNDETLWIYFGTGDVRNPEAIIGENRFFAIRDDSPETGGCAVTGAYTYRNLKDVTGTVYSQSCLDLGDDDKGWYIELGTAEKVLAYPTVHREVIYFTTFVPNLVDPCIIGNAYLYAVHYTKGCAAYNYPSANQQKIHLGTGVPTAPVIKGGRVYVGISGSAAGATLPSGWRKQGTMIVGPAASGTAGQDVVPVSWQELF